MNRPTANALSTRDELESVTATVVHPGGRLELVHLAGDDADRFAEIRLLIGARSITALVINDLDGAAAMAWIDEFGDRKGLRVNEVLAQLVHRPVAGAAVITGFGAGDRYSMTSLHDGFERELRRLAQDAR